MENASAHKTDEHINALNNDLRKQITALGGTHIHFDLSDNELENQFLQSVIDSEMQVKARKIVSVLQKMEFASDFIAEAEIPETNIEEHWIQLYELMRDKGIDLHVCSPNVGARELYRFVTEELFFLEIEDINMPGLRHCFTYDDFYPDHKYENERIAVEDCILCFLGNAAFDDLHYSEYVQLNNKYGLSMEAFHTEIQAFRAGYVYTKDIHVNVTECILEEQQSSVSGTWKATFALKENDTIKTGNWKVEFLWDDKTSYWLITKIQMENM
jgi:hypothetical protein